MTDGNEISLQELAAGLWRRKRLVLWTTLTVFSAVAIFTLLSNKIYTSEASLFVRLGRENARLDVTTTLGQTPGFAVPSDRAVEINSIAELMESRELLDDLVEHFGTSVILNEGEGFSDTSEVEASSGGFNPLSGLKNILRNIGILNPVSPHDLAIEKIRSRFVADPVKDTTLIELRYDSYDPKYSQNFLDELLNRYIDYHVKINRPENAPEFLEAQLKTVGEKLRLQESELDQLKTDSELYAFDDQRRLLAEQMSQLQQERESSEASRSALQSEVKSLRDRLAELPATVSLSTTTGAGNEGVDGMRQQFYQLQIEYQQVLADYTKEHPRAVRIKQQIDQASRILDDVEAKRTEVVSGPNQVHEQIRTEFIRKESALAAVESRIGSVDASIEKLRQRLGQFIASERKYRQLERDILVNEATYQNYSNNLEQARIDRELEERQLSNLSISDHATYNFSPS